MKLRLLLLMAIIPAFVLGMAKSDPPPEVDTGDFDQTDFHESNLEFAFGVFSKTYENTGENQNLFISPMSISMALSMAFNGASGETQNQMAEALGYDEIEVEKVNSGYHELMKALEEADSKVEILIGNALFGNKSISFNQDFQNTCASYYDAEIMSVDFGSNKAAGIINKWVKDATKGLIEKIIQRTSSDDFLYLINAIYFNGQWTMQFNKNATRDDDFHLADGSTKKIAFMNNSDEYRYMENDDFQAIFLPFGDERFGMYLFLPAEGKSLSNLTEMMSAHNWQQWTSSFTKRDGSITMPRFQMEYEKTLNDILREMGMDYAFNSGKADFSGISATPAFISEVIHKAVIKVDEEGAEAAAVTAVKMQLTSARPTSRFNMKVDRPYFIAIADTENNEVIFMGTVFEPKALEK